MSRRRITGSLVAAVLVLTLAAGCSGSDSSDAKDADAKTTTTAKGSGTTTTSEGDDDATGTTSAEGATSTTTAGTGTDVDEPELSGDFCEKTRQLQEGNFFADTTTDTSTKGKIAAVQDRFRIYASLYGQMADGAPEEIAEHVQAWADAASANYEKVKDMTSLTEVTELQTDFTKAAQSGELKAASDAIQAYLEKNCDLSLQ